MWPPTIIPNDLTDTIFSTANLTLVAFGSTCFASPCARRHLGKRLHQFGHFPFGETEGAEVYGLP